MSMTLTPANKSLIQRILNVFETGQANGDYANISIYGDGPGDMKQITYGRSQTTEFGNLRELIQMYVANRGQFAADFQPYVNRIGQKPSLYTDRTLIALLKKAGKEPIMISTQDQFFDKRYWMPAVSFAERNGFTLPFSMLVIYDSYIHSGSIPGFLRNRFSEKTPSAGGNEKAWISAYIEVRHSWLANHSRRILRSTTYRTQSFRNAIRAGNWDLARLPYPANGVNVYPAANLSPVPVPDTPVTTSPAVAADKPDDAPPILRLGFWFGGETGKSYVMKNFYEEATYDGKDFSMAPADLAPWLDLNDPSTTPVPVKLYLAGRNYAYQPQDLATASEPPYLLLYTKSPGLPAWPLPVLLKSPALAADPVLVRIVHGGFALAETGSFVHGCSAIQDALNKLAAAGKRAYAVDYGDGGALRGVFNESTEEALRSFQADNALPVTGTINKATVLKLDTLGI